MRLYDCRVIRSSSTGDVATWGFLNPTDGIQPADGVGLVEVKTTQLSERW